MTAEQQKPKRIPYGMQNWGDVRQMLDYYQQSYPFRHTTDELIEIMKPWYDNYCFAVKCLDEPLMYNSDMVLYFVYNYIDSNGQLPDNMLDTNIRTDYGKLRMLIRKDRGFEHDASVIQHIFETGTISAKLVDSFPSERIHSVLMENMAYDGDWRPFFEYITETLKRFAAQRNLQKGEAFVHGFTLSQKCMTRLYLPVAELDAGVRDLLGRGGYADIYILLQRMLCLCQG